MVVIDPDQTLHNTGIVQTFSECNFHGINTSVGMRVTLTLTLCILETPKWVL